MAQRLNEHERAASFLAAQRGEIEIERGIHGAQLRAALIKAGCIVPAGWAKHEIFEIDERGRREAAESIYFEEAGLVPLLLDGPYVLECEITDALAWLECLTKAHTITFRVGDTVHTASASVELSRIRDARQARARAWRELFPFTHDNGGAW